MRIPGASAARGSMGIPDEISPERVLKKPAPAKQQDAMFTEDGGAPESAAKVESEDGSEPAPPIETQQITDEDAKKVRPLNVLKEMGIELTEDDFSRLLFKGYIEKTVRVVYIPKEKRWFEATFKSLTGEEYDEADEQMGEDLQTIQMTRSGLDNRRSMWLLSYGCTKLAGRDVVKPVMTKGKETVVDTKATARARKKTLGALTTPVLNRMMELYGTFSLALDMIVRDPERAFLEKP